MRQQILALLVVLGAAVSVAASSSIKVTKAYSKPLPTVAPNGAAYMTIVNSSEQDHYVTGVSSSVAKKVEIHEMVKEDNRMRMQMVERLLLPAHSQVQLKPMGTHIMLMGLQKPLQSGEKFDLKMKIDKSSEPIIVPVEVN